MAILSDLQGSKGRILMIAAPLVIGSGIGLYYYFSKTSKQNKEAEKPVSVPKTKTSPQQEALKKALELKTLGNNCFRDEKFVEAIKHYSEAIKVCPDLKTKDLSTFYQNRAACYEKLNDFKNVISDCTQAIEYDKFYLKAYLRRGKAYQSVEDYEKASFDYYIAVASTQFQNTDYLQLFNDSIEKFASDKSRRIVSRRDSISFQNYLFRHLVNRLSRDPIKPQLSKYLANYNDEVMSLLRRNPAPGSDDSLTDQQELILGTVELHVGQHEQGKQRLQMLLEATQDKDYKVNILVKLAEIASQQQDVPGAMSLLDQAELIDSGNADLHYMRSQMNIVNKDYSKAIHCLQLAIELDPQFVCAKGQKLFIELQQCMMLNDADTRDKKLEEFNTLVKDHSNSNEILLLYFQILMSQDRSDEAEVYIKKAIANHPDDPSLYVFQAMIHFERENYEVARDLLDQAVKIDSRCSFAYEMLSDLCCRAGNVREALEYLETAYTNSTTFDDIKNLVIKHTSLQFQQKLTSFSK